MTKEEKKAYQKRYRELNKERLKEYDRWYRYLNRDKLILYAKSWYREKGYEIKKIYLENKRLDTM